MKVAYVTTYDSTKVAEFNGVGYYIAKSLQNHSISLEKIGSLRGKYSYSILFRMKEYFYKWLRKKIYNRNRDRILIKYFAGQISRQLSRLDVDIVFSPISPGSQPIAYLECEQPIVIWTDATFAGVIDFYPFFNQLCKENIRDGITNERAALNRCNLAIFSSEWAAQTAIESYQIDPAKVKVVPFGANLESDRNTDDMETIVNSRPVDTCKLLFLGKDWHRKGGDIAFQVAKALNKMGLNTELTVVGCQPDINEPLPNFVRPLGYISKSTKEGVDQINRLLAETHFLILPSKAEAFGHVFCEASSFGVPSLATNVGGIPTAIRDNMNGKTFSKDADISEYCIYISNLFRDYSQYRNLALSSFNEYQSRLNWTVAGQTVKKLMMELIL